MNLSEIIKDALVYPFNNIKALVIYAILGIIVGLAAGSSIVGMGLGIMNNNTGIAVGSGILGMIIALIIGFVISGYQLDIIKYGINRDSGSPGIDFVRQFVNGIKLLVVGIVYFIIPIIITAILGVIFQNWLSTIIGIILFIIFALAAIMGECRLAKTESLGNALAIGEAIGDISKIGFLKVLLFIIVIAIITAIIMFIGNAVIQLNETVGGIILGILSVYLTFFVARATGLLYSDA